MLKLVKIIDLLIDKDIEFMHTNNKNNNALMYLCDNDLKDQFIKLMKKEPRLLSHITYSN